MKRFRSLSARRRLLLAGVVLVLVLMLVLRSIGVAGFNGTQVRDMDWDSDGEVTRGEILQGFSTVVVDETREGNRVCRSYARLRDRQDALRVDCRVEFAPKQSP